MPFATIAGISVQFVTFSEMPEEYAGEEVRSFNHFLLSSLRNPKRRWMGETRPYTHTEFAAVRSATAGGALVACAGDAFQGAAPSCRVKLTAMPYSRALRRTTDRALNATGFEVSYSVEFVEA